MRLYSEVCAAIQCYAIIHIRYGKIFFYFATWKKARWIECRLYDTVVGDRIDSHMYMYTEEKCHWFSDGTLKEDKFSWIFFPIWTFRFFLRWKCRLKHCLSRKAPPLAFSIGLAKEGRTEGREEGRRKGEFVLKSAFLEGLFALKPLGLEVSKVWELSALEELESPLEIHQNCWKNAICRTFLPWER